MFSSLAIIPYSSLFRELRRVYHTHLIKDAKTLFRADVETKAYSYVLRAVQEGRNIAGDYEMFVHSNPLS